MGGELIQVLDAGASPRALAKDLRERSAQSGVRTQSSYRAVRAGQNCVWCCVSAGQTEWRGGAELRAAVHICGDFRCRHQKQVCSSHSDHCPPPSPSFLPKEHVLQSRRNVTLQQ